MKIKKLIEQIKTKNLDALLVSTRENIYYLSGFYPSSSKDREAFLFITLDKVTLIVPKLYEIEAYEQTRGDIGIQPTYNLYDDTKDLISKYKNVGFETFNLLHREYEFFKESTGKFVPQRSIVENLRMIKSRDEITLIKKAVKITDNTYKKILNTDLINKSEIEISEIIRSEFLKETGLEPAFDTIVANGQNSAKPHHKNTNKKIKEGILLIDMGAKYKSYCADLSRTTHIGNPPDTKFKDLYKIVYNTNQEIITDLKPEIAIQSLQEKANKLLGKYSKYFPHALGHGVGINIHEAPGISSNSTLKLRAGMTITIEPGIYIPNWGGIRIEDYILITKQGHKKLSQAPYSFFQ